jgi:hypothetical protein
MPGSLGGGRTERKWVPALVGYSPAGMWDTVKEERAGS